MSVCLGRHAQNGWLCCYRWACLWHSPMFVVASRLEPCNTFFLLHPFLTSKTCHCMFKPNITNTFFMVKLESYHWHHRSFLFDGGSIFFGSLSQPNSWSESISPAKQLNNPHGLHILKRETFTSNKWIPQGSPMGQFGSISKLQVHFKCQLCVTCLVLPIWDFHSHVCIKYNILYNYYRIYHASSSLYTNHTSRNPFSSIWSSLFWLQCHAPHSRQPLRKGLKIGALWSQRLMPLCHSTKLRDHTGLEPYLAGDLDDKRLSHWQVSFWEVSSGCACGNQQVARKPVSVIPPSRAPLQCPGKSNTWPTHSEKNMCSA